MKPTEPRRITDLKSGYGTLKPDGWAVTRMKARLAREKYDPAEQIPRLVMGVFRRYVLAAVVTLFALTAWLDMASSPTDAILSEASALESWLMGEPGDDAIADIPEFTFLMNY